MQAGKQASSKAVQRDTVVGLLSVLPKGYLLLRVGVLLILGTGEVDDALVSLEELGHALRVKFGL